MATEEAENNAQEDAISEESCIPVEKWKNESVLEFLEAIGLNQLIQLFKEHEITGRDLISLNTQEMREDLQITNLHVRKKLCRQIEKLKGQVGIQEMIVKVLYFSKETRFRVINMDYTLSDLLSECMRIYNISNERNLLFKDSEENVLPFSTRIWDLEIANEAYIEVYLIQNNFLSSSQISEKILQTTEPKYAHSMMNYDTPHRSLGSHPSTGQIPAPNRSFPIGPGLPQIQGRRSGNVSQVDKRGDRSRDSSENITPDTTDFGVPQSQFENLGNLLYSNESNLPMSIALGTLTQEDPTFREPSRREEGIKFMEEKECQTECQRDINSPRMRVHSDPYIGGQTLGRISQTPVSQTHGCKDMYIQTEPVEIVVRDPLTQGFPCNYMQASPILLQQSEIIDSEPSLATLSTDLKGSSISLSLGDDPRGSTSNINDMGVDHMYSHFRLDRDAVDTQGTVDRVPVSVKYPQTYAHNSRELSARIHISPLPQGLSREPQLHSKSKMGGTFPQSRVRGESFSKYLENSRQEKGFSPLTFSNISKKEQEISNFMSSHHESYTGEVSDLFPEPLPNAHSQIPRIVAFSPKFPEETKTLHVIGSSVEENRPRSMERVGISENKDRVVPEKRQEKESQIGVRSPMKQEVEDLIEKLKADSKQYGAIDTRSKKPRNYFPSFSNREDFKEQKKSVGGEDRRSEPMKGEVHSDSRESLTGESLSLATQTDTSYLREKLRGYRVLLLHKLRGVGREGELQVGETLPRLLQTLGPRGIDGIKPQYLSPHTYNTTSIINTTTKLGTKVTSPSRHRQARISRETDKLIAQNKKRIAEIKLQILNQRYSPNNTRRKMLLFINNHTNNGEIQINPSHST